MTSSSGRAVDLYDTTLRDGTQRAGISLSVDDKLKVLGRLGRSWGCPAVSETVAQKIIDTIRGGSAIFSYYPDKEWLSKSTFLR